MQKWYDGLTRYDGRMRYDGWTKYDGQTRYNGRTKCDGRKQEYSYVFLDWHSDQYSQAG